MVTSYPSPAILQFGEHTFSGWRAGPKVAKALFGEHTSYPQT